MTRSLNRQPRARAVAIAVLAMIAFAGCGQKPGVHVATGGAGLPTAGGNIRAGGGSAVGATDGTLPDGSIDGSVAGDPSGAAGGDAGGPTAGAGGTTGGGGGAAPNPAAAGLPPKSGSNRTGASASAITVAVHAPVTGAAPLPATSFEKSADLYWRWITEAKGQKVLGRSKVNVVFKDDKYTPSTAVQVCRELSASSFLLVGGGGTDQIQACGRFADQNRIPYLSPGVTESGLEKLPYYFAVSMSYRQQADLLAQYIKKNMAGKKVAMIVTDTPNFDDAIAGWEAAVAKHGISYYKTLKHTKGDTSWINSFGSELRANGVQVIYPLTAPVDYIRFAQQNSGDFAYAGVGITMGLNAVAGSGCPHVNGGTWLSPIPGLDWARTNVQDFFAAGQRFGAPTDDIALLLWGIAASVHQMLIQYGAAYGDDLTREDFRAVVERSSIDTKLFPPSTYAPDNHYGARSVNVIRTDCGAEEHKTVATFVSGF